MWVLFGPVQFSHDRKELVDENRFECAKVLVATTLIGRMSDYVGCVHDDHHGHHPAFGNEVVKHDLGESATTGPIPFVARCPGQQDQQRVLSDRCGLIVRRRVHDESPHELLS